MKNSVGDLDIAGGTSRFGGGGIEVDGTEVAGEVIDEDDEDKDVGTEDLDGKLGVKC